MNKLQDSGRWDIVLDSNLSPRQPGAAPGCLDLHHLLSNTPIGTAVALPKVGGSNFLLLSPTLLWIQGWPTSLSTSGYKSKDKSCLTLAL